MLDTSMYWSKGLKICVVFTKEMSRSCTRTFGPMKRSEAERGPFTLLTKFNQCQRTHKSHLWIYYRKMYFPFYFILYLSFVRMLFLRTCCAVSFCGEIRYVSIYLGSALHTKAAFTEIYILWEVVTEVFARHRKNFGKVFSFLLSPFLPVYFNMKYIKTK